MEGENSVMAADAAVTVPPATCPALPPASLRPTREPTEKARTRAGSAGLTSSLLESMDPHGQEGWRRQEEGGNRTGVIAKVTVLADTRQQRHQRTTRPGMPAHTHILYILKHTHTISLQPLYYPLA